MSEEEKSKGRFGLGDYLIGFGILALTFTLGGYAGDIALRNSIKPYLSQTGRLDKIGEKSGDGEDDFEFTYSLKENGKEYSINFISQVDGSWISREQHENRVIEGHKERGYEELKKLDDALEDRAEDRE